MFSIVIPTYNRSNDLVETLHSMAAISTRHVWEVIVVDNNCSDDTKSVVLALANSFPTDLHYVFEGEQGRCAALNAGLARARGEIVMTTDDDVRVEPDWPDQALRALDTLECDYVGGKVFPIWTRERPEWVPEYPSKLWSVLAL